MPHVDQRFPRNDEAAIIDEVVNSLLVDGGTVDKVLNIHKAWLGQADPATGEIFIQRVLAEEPWENQAASWVLFYLLIHEQLHLWEHWRHRDHRRGLGIHTQAYNTQTEGGVAWLTEVVASVVDPRDPAVRAVIEGEYTREATATTGPDAQPGDLRYPSMAQVRQLGYA